MNDGNSNTPATPNLLRAIKRFVPDLWCHATQRFRRLPETVIIGAQEAGTAQLYDCVARHPDCFAADRKQAGEKSSGIDSSVARLQLDHKVQGVCLGPAPGYLPLSETLRRMGDVLPDAKVILLLRDPVARAFSHYQDCKTRRLESRTFAEVVGDAVLDPTYRLHRGTASAADAPPILGYIARGYYALQIEPLLRAYPREQLLILDSADLFGDASATCQRVFQFLGLEPWDVTSCSFRHRGYQRQLIDPVTAYQLCEHYRPYDELLSEMVGQRFSWMDSGPALKAA